jgi:predicted kinase
MKERHLLLIRGLPGSGKTTLAMALQEYAAASGALGGIVPAVHAADDYFTDEDGEYHFDASKLPDAHADCHRKVRKAMGYGVNVIVYNTFTQLREMKPYMDLADEFGYSVSEIVCRGNFGSVHGVPEEAIERMRNRWEE